MKVSLAAGQRVPDIPTDGVRGTRHAADGHNQTAPPEARLAAAVVTVDRSAPAQLQMGNSSALISAPSSRDGGSEVTPPASANCGSFQRQLGWDMRVGGTAHLETNAQPFGPNRALSGGIIVVTSIYASAHFTVRLASNMVAVRPPPRPLLPVRAI